MDFAQKQRWISRRLLLYVHQKRRAIFIAVILCCFLFTALVLMANQQIDKNPEKKLVAIQAGQVSRNAPPPARPVWIKIEPNYSIRNPKTNQEVAWNFFIRKGLRPIESAGIVGNLMQENHCMPDDTSGGLGVAQLCGELREEFLIRCAKKGLDPFVLETQLEFILYKLGSDYYKDAREGLASAETVEEATRVFQDEFERPGIPMFENRLNFAKEIYDLAMSQY